MIIQNEIKIPFQLLGSKIYIPLQINNLKKSKFVLDTGAPIWMIELDHAEEIALPLDNPLQLQLMGASGEGAPTAYQLSGLNIQLPGVQLDNQNAMVIPMPHVKIGYPNLQGIIGGSFIQQFVLALDFVNQTISLYDPVIYDYQGTGEIVPIKISNGLPFVKASITPQGNDPIEGFFAIDLGASAAVSLNTPTVRNNQLTEKSHKLIQSALGFGVGGAIYGYVTRARSFKIGSFVIENPLTSFADTDKGAQSQASFVGGIGIEVLRRFNLILDYSRERIILEKNVDFDSPTEHDMSGLVLVNENEQIRISNVIEDSPAAANGLAVGDQITHVDDQKITCYDLENLRLKFKQLGNTHKLQVKRKGSDFEVAIKLKRMV